MLGVENSIFGVEIWGAGVEISSSGVEGAIPGVEICMPGVEIAIIGVEEIIFGVKISPVGVERRILGVEISSAEQQANAFAAAILIPQKFIVEEARKLNLDLNDESPAISELAKKFNVSLMAMSIRLAKLHLIHGHDADSTKRKSTPFRRFDY